MVSFEEAADRVKQLKTSPSNEQLLELYGLFKQATVGDNNTDKPGLFDMKGKAKWGAWEAKKGTSQETAKTEYVGLVQKLEEQYGTK